MAEKSKKEKKKVRERLSRFRKEFRNTTKTAIISAFGLLVALVWKDVITEYVDKISGVSPIQGKLFGALIVTLIAVIGIIALTKFLSEKEEDKK